jgi:ATP-dependent helicase HrpB
MISLLEAEPGAGKTTRVPQALLSAGRKHIFVLEPRRLAARLAAQRVAEELREGVGSTVGFQVRFETVGSADTRIWYVTEGVLTNRLLGGEELPHGAVVLLDEFHERHIETDLALALLRRIQNSRQDLRVGLMSATLGAEELAEKLGGAPMIQAPGRTYPVETQFTPASAQSLEQQVASALPDVIERTNGHVLVFLPGVSEIRRTIRDCEPIARSRGMKVLPLYGDLSSEEQDAAVAPSSTRKIICSTNVAESSITIEDVEAVIDSGWARVPVQSAWTGLSQLGLEEVSRSSAIQRAGRAGRTAPGLAVRLYTESDFNRRPYHSQPEILRADLSSVLLQVAASNIEHSELGWIDPPGKEIVDQARELLLRLGALDKAYRATPVGREMARLPLEPRLARFVTDATAMGAGQPACHIAAYLSTAGGRIESSAQGVSSR